jgi:hypothetical protein
VEKNEVLLENLGADIRSQDQTYGPKYYSERMASSLEV